jgi:hypothetical protein
MHDKLTDWRAKRAGGRMTVYGKDANGAEAKIVGVDRIERREDEGHRMTFAIIDHVTPLRVIHLAD